MQVDVHRPTPSVRSPALVSGQKSVASVDVQSRAANVDCGIQPQEWHSPFANSSQAAGVASFSANAPRATDVASIHANVPQATDVASLFADVPRD